MVCEHTTTLHKINNINISNKPSIPDNLILRPKFFLNTSRELLLSSTYENVKKNGLTALKKIFNT